MAAEPDSSLARFVSSLSGGDGLRVEETLGSGFVRLRVSEAERRQAKHDIRCVEDAVIELLRNSRDAGATHVFLATMREGSKRTLLVFDDGSGIPSSMHQRVFDARVTSKLDSMTMDRWGVHGRGMALFSIKENAESAWVTCSDVGLGTAMAIVFDAMAIAERADQSTWPSVQEQKGDFVVRGPRNIVRACVEFALEAKGQCIAYVGSPSEIVATMRRRIRPSAATERRYLAGNIEGIPVVERAALAQDARELCELMAPMGVTMSERTAYRILRTEIAPLRNARVEAVGRGDASRRRTKGVGTRRISLSEDDRDELIDCMTKDFARVAERYFVTLDGKPAIRVGEGKVTVTFGYVDDD